MLGYVGCLRFACPFQLIYLMSLHVHVHSTGANFRSDAVTCARKRFIAIIGHPVHCLSADQCTRVEALWCDSLA